MSIYKIAKFKDVDEFLRTVAASRGKLKKVRTHIPQMFPPLQIFVGSLFVVRLEAAEASVGRVKTCLQRWLV